MHGRNWGNGISISNTHGGVVEANHVQVSALWARQGWLPLLDILAGHLDIHIGRIVFLGHSLGIVSVRSCL